MRKDKALKEPVMRLWREWLPSSHGGLFDVPGGEACPCSVHIAEIGDNATGEFNLIAGG
jgi:hypothetical protein